MISADEYRHIYIKIAELKRQKQQADIEFVNYCRETKCVGCPMYKNEILCDTPVYLEFNDTI